MKLGELCKILQGELVGNGDIEIKNLAKIQDAQEGDLTFLANPKYRKYLNTTRASAILVGRSDSIEGIAHVKVDEPYLSFQKTLNLIYPEKVLHFKGIDQSAIINESAEIADDAVIGPLVYIGHGAKIGSKSIIYPGTIISDDVSIGKNCLIYSNVCIYNNCEIHDNVILHCGVVIGSDGFGFAPEGKTYNKIPQIGKVVIESDVEMGANCTIDRATIGETRIKKGCKIDNLVQIAHNVIVGENTVIAAQAGVSGSTKIGQHVTVAGQVGIVGHIEVGNDAVLAAQSGISKSVPEGEIWFGYPAGPISKQKKIEANLRHLPDLNKKVKKLEKTIEELKARLRELENGE